MDVLTFMSSCLFMFQGGQTGHVSLTAYILIALAEANSKSPVSCVDMVVGMDCKGRMQLSIRHSNIILIR